MKKTIKIRLYPNKEQEKQFYIFSNTARFVYNESLAYSIKYYEEKKKYSNVQDMINHIKELKYNDHSWILDTPESVSKQAIKDLEKAFKNYHAKISKFPKFKKRNRCKPSFYQRTDAFHKVDNSHVKITGICKPIKIKYKKIPNHVYNTRITYDSKYWYLSISYDVESVIIKKKENVIGIDLGIKETITTSNGETFGNINKTKEIRKLEKRKKRLQRNLANKYELNKQGNIFTKTNNIIKLEKIIKLIDRKLTNIRNTYRHTITKKIIEEEPSSIIVEDLNVCGILKNKYLSDSIRKQGFTDIINKLKYKCELNGISFIKADRFFPSSKKCSKCGNIKRNLKLSNRIYNCEVCGLTIDRDYNAAINLKHFYM